MEDRLKILIQKIKNQNVQFQERSKKIDEQFAQIIRLLQGEKEIDEPKNEIPDYKSVGPSFSFSADSSSDLTKESRIGGEIYKECLKEIDSGDESNDCFVRKFNDTRSIGVPERKEAKQMVGGKSQPMKSSFYAYNFLEEGEASDSGDDYVVAGDKSTVNQVGKHNRKARHKRKRSDNFDSHDFVSRGFYLLLLKYLLGFTEKMLLQKCNPSAFRMRGL